MRVVGYVRESLDPDEGRPAFAQQEALRRHASIEGMHLVSICTDTREPGHELGRAGYLSLLGVIAAGTVDAVLVAGLDTLSADTIVQEIMMWDLRSRGVRILSTDASDLDALSDPGPSRLFIRDVLTRVGEHAALVGTTPEIPREDTDDVVIQLVTDPSDVATEG